MLTNNSAGNPLVTIVIVNYETSAYVKRCVQSLAKESFPHEIIVVDNPSPAGDIANLNDLSDNVQVVASPANVGFGLGCNLGANHASPSSEYIAILNPDTALPPTQLGRWIAAHQAACQRGGILGPALHNENGTIQKSHYRFPNGLNYWFSHSLLAGFIINLKKGSWSGGKGGGFAAAAAIKDAAFDEEHFKPVKCDWLMGAALLIDTNTWHALGGFSDKYFLYSEDTDLCWRALQQKFEIFYDPTVHIWHTQGDPAGAAREVAIVRLFDGLKLFVDLNYKGLRKAGMYASVITDMILRCIILRTIEMAKGPNDLRTSRLNGYRKVIQHWRNIAG